MIPDPDNTQFLPQQKDRALYSSPPTSPMGPHMNNNEIPSPIALQVVEPPAFVLPKSPLPSSESDEETTLKVYPTEYHAIINGKPCDQNGNRLPDGIAPLPTKPQNSNDWSPFNDGLAFRTAKSFFKNKFSAGKIDEILQLWAESLAKHDDDPPFINHQDLYDSIDSIPLGSVPWESSSFTYNDPDITPDSPKWMTSDYTIWYRDPCQLFLQMLQNPDFATTFDYSPLHQYDKEGNHQYQNFMSGNWTWKQADILSANPEYSGSMFVPIIIGSDKTTVSVGTGDNEFWPLYGSIGNLHNNVRRAHGAGLVLIGFLSIPKADKAHAADPKFRRFRRQLFHLSLSKIFGSLRPGMETPELARCPDGHLRQIIWGLGPYIADYPEQVLLACIVQGWCPICRAPPQNLDGEESNRPRTKEITEALIQTFDVPDLWSDHGIISDVVPFTNDFPRADIHELIAPDLLHQIIKGTFKDHLVSWVEDYLILKHGKTRACRILDDIDHRISIAPPFAGLRRFPEGREFKQWTGDDSKALMKVYLPALCGHLPKEVIRTFRAFLEFCYIVRKDVLTEVDLLQADEALSRFHHYRTIFVTSGVCPNGFSLPCQHSLIHYTSRIRDFGAPNGLCSSITESKHIRAVKEPWHRSNRNEPLGQMLVTNQRLDQLSAAQTNFGNRGMVSGTHPNELLYPEPTGNNPIDIPAQTSIPDEDVEELVTDLDVQAEVVLAFKPKYRWSLLKAPEKLELPSFPTMLRCFLYDQLYPDSSIPSSNLSVHAYPQFYGRVSIFYNTTATFRAPSDLSGIGCMCREYIRATPSWRNSRPRYDTVFINFDPSQEGMRGLEVARVLTFFSFTHEGKPYQCALVHWFSRVRNEPDEDMGLWVLKPDFNDDGKPDLAIVHVDTIYRAAHLIPVYSSQYLRRSLTMHDTLDVFNEFYANKFVDYQAFQIAL